MKLSEVIKAIEDGNLNEFKLNGFSDLIRKYKTQNSIIFGDYSFPIDGWEEVKPPRQWSEKELMLFKLLPDWAKWIKSNCFNEIVIYESNDSNLNQRYEKIDETIFDFLTITFEESPIYIGDLKGE